MQPARAYARTLTGEREMLLASDGSELPEEADAAVDAAGWQEYQHFYWCRVSLAPPGSNRAEANLRHLVAPVDFRDGCRRYWKVFTGGAVPGIQAFCWFRRTASRWRWAHHQP